MSPRRGESLGAPSLEPIRYVERTIMLFLFKMWSVISVANWAYCILFSTF